jgi:predicted TIM-barrel fold metal-dependent hydrolase
MTLRLISADDHFIEPPVIWTDYMDPEFRDRGPRLVSHGGYDTYEMESVILPPIGMPGSAGKATRDIRLEGRFEDVPKAAYDPEERIKAMDVDGVAAAVIYPTVAMRLHSARDAQLKHACFQAYNRWAAEFCTRYSDRTKAVGVVALNDIDQGVAELRQVAQLGLAAAFISVNPGGEEDYGSARYDPFWATAQELDLPVSLHVGSEKERWERTRVPKAANQLIGIQRSLAQMILGGVFDRFPKLRIVSAENHVGWVPYFMQATDHNYTRMAALHGPDRLELALLPSEYLHRQVSFTFIPFDTWWVPIRDRIGVDRILWSSDYPHTESTWPNSRRVVEDLFRGVPEQEKRMMAGGNAAQLFGFA